MQILEGTQHEPGPDQQVKRERDLRDHQNPAGTIARPAGGLTASAGTQRWIEIYLGGLNRGNQSE